MGPRGPSPERRAVSGHRGCAALPRFPSPPSEAGVLGPLTLSLQRRGPPWTWRPARQPEPSLRSTVASASAGATRSSRARRPGCPTAVGPALGQRRGSNPTPSRPPRQPPPPAPPAPGPAPKTLATTNQGRVRQPHFRTQAHVTQITQALRRRGEEPRMRH